ncbi:hypothetical protein V7139_09560 [Neobacillus drentensis]|uniref:hypothetical protein n=1 Tax=Neobacillus drentensis TaxID=220684 RepID=UPI003001C799
MSEKLYADLRDLSLGLNQKDGATLILDQELVDAENVILGKGFAQKRYGFEKYSNQLANPITKLYDYKKYNGTKEFLSVSNKQLYKDNNGTLTAITGALTSNSVKFMTYKDRSINDATVIADGGKLKVYKGTSVSEVSPRTPNTAEQTYPGLNDLANLSNFRTFALKKDRIFAAAHPTVKNRVSYNYFDPYLGYGVYDYFPAIYFFDVATEDNDEIVELKVFRDLLIILCKKSVWALRGDGVTLNDNEVFKINVPIGCIASGSVQEVGNNLFYLGDDNVYSIFATDRDFVSGQIMSDKIAPILKSIGSTDKALATSVFFDNKYWLSFPSGLTLVYDTILENWTKFTNIKANSFLVRDGVLYFSSNAGYIYRFNENKFSDDGQPINYMIKSKILDLGAPINKKKFRRLWINQKQFDSYHSSFQIKVLIDQSNLIDLATSSDSSGTNEQGVWDVSDWDEAIWDTTETLINKFRVRQQSKDIQIQIFNNIVDEPLSILGFVLEYEMKKPK